MAKFKTDGFRIAKDFIATGLFTDARVYKDRGNIEIWVVKEGMLYGGRFSGGYNTFKSQEEVNEAIANFVKTNI